LTDTSFYIHICVKRFGMAHINYQSHLRRPCSRRGIYSSMTTLPLEMGSICCPETWGTNYQSKLRNTPEDLRSHFNRDRSLKSRTFCHISTKPDNNEAIHTRKKYIKIHCITTNRLLAWFVLLFRKSLNQCSSFLRWWWWYCRC